MWQATKVNIYCSFAIVGEIIVGDGIIVTGEQIDTGAVDVDDEVMWDGVVVGDEDEEGGVVVFGDDVIMYVVVVWVDFDARIEAGAGDASTVLYGKSSESNVVCWCLYVDDIVLVTTVDDGGGFVFAFEGYGGFDEEVFDIGSRVNIDEVIGCCVI